MKITKLVKTEQTVQMDVELPYFCVSNNTYYKVESEKFTLSAYNGESHDYWSITRCYTSSKIAEMAKAQTITEDEFNAAFDAIKSNLLIRETQNQ